MFKKQDGFSALIHFFNTTNLITGNLIGLLLTVFIPSLQPIAPFLRIILTVLFAMFGIRWLERNQELPTWFFGALPWAGIGVVGYFASLALQEVLEIWFDFSAYQLLIDLVSSACPALFGAIGAIKHKDDTFEEDHNNG